MMLFALADNVHFSIFHLFHGYLRNFVFKDTAEVSEEVELFKEVATNTLTVELKQGMIPRVQGPRTQLKIRPKNRAKMETMKANQKMGQILFHWYLMVLAMRRMIQVCPLSGRTMRVFLSDNLDLPIN